MINDDKQNIYQLQGLNETFDIIYLGLIHEINII